MPFLRWSMFVGEGGCLAEYFFVVDPDIFGTLEKQWNVKYAEVPPPSYLNAHLAPGASRIHRDPTNQDQLVGVASIGYAVDRMPRSPFPIKSSPMSELCRLCFCNGSLSWDFFAIGARKSGLRHHNRKNRGSAAHRSKELHYPHALCNARADHSGRQLHSRNAGARVVGTLSPIRCNP
ncbi:hypothetical protein BDP55DRAFT_714933 [Colletotrichum godetiae]|uniref:Uncharacterized protein n=1 Tax=Colletotrichum godetiae TaxID=1209918 RepID=A0AAJ0AQZ6_9PEZI|nr:uncharacterized protein BDP55DRAFT_714933 [Colletotrichum godetiae]KAK1676216.1 hypothetical protein BDP55DRAFT_714933 [Colletotrichum godetiae]